MRQLLKLFLIAVWVTGAQAIFAAPGELRPLPAHLIEANAAPKRVTFAGRADEGTKSLDLIASVGEALAVEVVSSEFDDPCAVGWSVHDSRGRLVAQQECGAGAGFVAPFRAPATGAYQLRVVPKPGVAGALELTLRSAERPYAAAAACVTKTLSLDASVSGQWSTDCSSVSFSGHFAQYYTFTLPSPQVVTIALNSATNPYLLLRSGPTSTGPLIAQDDNGGPGSNAMIVRSLAAGTYTIEATTSGSGAIGNFSVVARTNSAPCFATLLLDAPATSQWVDACESNTFPDHYAKYYTLTVPTNEVVTISLSSAANAYLLLRSGNQLGPLVAQDENSGPGTDAMIVRTLTAGTYTIEATTSPASTLGAFTVAARTNTDPCFTRLSLDIALPAQLSPACESNTFPDHYSKYYTITVPQEQVVTISLASKDANTYLLLRSGNQLGTLIAQDENSGPGTDAMIVRTLAAGTYTIEATTSPASQLGSFVIAARTNTTPCFTRLSLDVALSSQWNTSCESNTFPDRYSRYYTITVPQEQVITISLASKDTNTYLLLRSGNQLGTLIAQDENSGPGTDAMIVRTLAAGTYTIEATTSPTSALGAFVIAARTNTAPCVTSAPIGGVRTDSWSTDCESVSFPDHYAKYYTLQVSAPRTVSITLTSGTADAYLVLRAGSQLGSVVAQDNNSAGGFNARILRSLAAGVYTIEATTAPTNQVGSFALTVGN